MKRSHGKTILKYTLMTVIPLILGAASFLFFLSYTGQIDLKDYFRGVTLDPWPAYDQDYRLDMQEEPLTEEQVKKEANRCLKCGATVVDTNRCIGCGLCTTRCEFDAIHLSRDLPQNTRMFTGEDGVYKAILPYMIKRKIKMKFMKKEK